MFQVQEVAHHLQLPDSVAIAGHNVGVVQGSPTGSICALPLSFDITSQRQRLDNLQAGQVLCDVFAGQATQNRCN